MTLNNSMSITPSPPGQAKGAKFEHGSVLGGKTRGARVSSQWKSTVARLKRTNSNLMGVFAPIQLREMNDATRYDRFGAHGREHGPAPDGGRAQSRRL